ncbi:NAD(P)H-dependent glycerol-3-phosphate dehydrogenase [Caloramator sp. CAR-1]|uniref:NAD(P)H-dependent glycerol-3-phosphate dehydrogenase n=1 Tax=Caloramator sp. CAR-1 TaxID=3062777 RepID=UPI0026E44624|nr:NAD(P)H-dependent glycerol-3-phosphate dehydrogenase [Caloramator sp. CAR-1]MDO6354391.1 NAD(P)H-dependent glycerol-3-phosphate dehydrogenase [Caloramator sp. CAR-1]
MKIAVLGGGSWGTAIAVLLSKKSNDVYIWDRNASILEEIKYKRQNSKYLPDVIIPKNVDVRFNLEETIKSSDIIVVAVPSHAVRELCLKIKEFVNENQIFVSLTKGIEDKTFKRMSEILGEFFPNNKIAVLSGPSHAEEVSKDIPTAIVAASKDEDTALKVQDIFMTPNFRVYTNTDVVGVEIGGAVKNIIALAAGISDGLGFGDNTKAALMTRGIAEIARLGTALGANPMTFAGLSGIGDLIVTCTSMHSRNRRAGILIGKGKKVEEALSEIKMVVEGVNTTKSTYELSKKIGIEMPITEKLYNVLFNGKDAKEAVTELMQRDKKDEIQYSSYFVR